MIKLISKFLKHFLHFFKMNINHIFDLFNNEQPEEDENSLLIDFSEHPLFWIGGFNKSIDNHVFFKKYTSKMFGETSTDMDLDEIERVGEILVFEKAWGYIKKINLENPFHLECIASKASERFLDNLFISIKHFEVLEEYEKCALLKGIENKVKDFLI